MARTRQTESPPDSPRITTIRTAVDLPVEGWKGLFLLTMKRLERRDPRLADLLNLEMQMADTVWQALRPSDPRSHHWLAQFLRMMEEQRLPRGKVKPAPNYPTYFLFLHYGRVRSMLQQEPPETRAEAPFLRELLDSLGEQGRETQVTHQLQTIVGHESPSEAAFAIVGTAFGRSVPFLKREFVKARKTARFLAGLRDTPPLRSSE